MLNETRVNLKHLLEDIRDSYSIPLEEVIVVELIANALDSKATRFDIEVNTAERFLRCTDNGVGMKRVVLKDYHNIAASTKMRGVGIGFAGIGAKLSLLVAETVVTESKGGRGSRAATEWRLTNPFRAPWKFVPFSDTMHSPRGTSVRLNFTDGNTKLLNADFVRSTVIRHFYPLFHERLREEILRYVYKKGMQFTVDGELLDIPDAEQRVDNVFRVKLGKGRRPIGAGFLTKNILVGGWLAQLTGQAPSEHHLASGLSVSTYGKIIKGGWEWLGLSLKSADTLCGIVEVPAMSELLTTNKSDFLTDAIHLRKYYRLRRAIQEAVIPVLRLLGEYGAESARPSIEKNIKPLTKEIEAALERVSDEFPELAPLLAARRGTGAPQKKEGDAGAADESNGSQKNDSEGVREGIEEKKQSKQRGNTGEGGGSRKRPGLTIVLAELAEEPRALGRVQEETVLVNTVHPAWKKALATKQEEYHIVLVTALSLSEYLDPEKNPQHFLEELLRAWSEGGQQKSLW